MTKTKIVLDLLKCKSLTVNQMATMTGFPRQTVKGTISNLRLLKCIESTPKKNSKEVYYRFLCYPRPAVRPSEDQLGPPIPPVLQSRRAVRSGSGIIAGRRYLAPMTPLTTRNLYEAWELAMLVRK